MKQYHCLFRGAPGCSKKFEEKQILHKEYEKAATIETKKLESTHFTL